MANLEEITVGVSVDGLASEGRAAIVAVNWYGDTTVEVTYKDESGRTDTRLLMRQDEPSLRVDDSVRPWSFDGDPSDFRLAVEAMRIDLASLFDPHLAVHTSTVDPLPHQILAVYQAMLPRSPLRFLLADDPGAGKTIMAGLLIKELMARATSNGAWSSPRAGWSDSGRTSWTKSFNCRSRSRHPINLKRHAPAIGS